MKISCLTFSPDGHHIAIVASDSVRVWDAEPGATSSPSSSERVVPFGGVQPGRAPTRHRGLSDVAGVGPAGGPRTARTPRVFGSDVLGGVQPGWAPVAAVDGGIMRVWDSEPEPELLTPRAGEPGITPGCSARTGPTRLDRLRQHSSDLGHVTGFQYLALEPRGHEALSVAFSPDGLALLCATDGVRIWDAATGVQGPSLATRARAAFSTRWRSARTAATWPLPAKIR